MALEIRPFDPAGAGERELVEYHTMRAAAVLVDWPEDPPLTYDSAIGRLQAPPLEDGVCRYWAGYLAGRLVGTAKLGLPDGSNAAVARVEVHVHPELRRQGIGTGLLRTVLGAVRESGRETVVGLPMKPEAAAASWAARHGFEVTQRMVMQALLVAATPARMWEVQVAAGYRLADWSGATPEELVDSYAVARQAIEDAPRGRSSFRATAWTAERVREADRELAGNGVEQRVVVAVEQSTGAVVGTHVVHLLPYRREFGFVYDTSVVAAHRGHGLGRAMKAAMMRHLTVERPELSRVLTSTAAVNTHMISVNHTLGYETVRMMELVEARTADLEKRLADGRA
ncbi:GNAT family N-acetyltransferase [Kitasatospora sp. MMS16-BH015]|uniref:GNAT family N-acetyltransferase n=1 Tax=Kitasatospora sp. MMS16-BH015 TaxID=2018025 RepID=UPI000CA0CB5C|nr:GNAT family N-acetyltransferase [Kitasatospora sp. MMS16-BH015]AUG75163.1 GNAT family N-acetyltransferase [Kitasatospora sp. MMS16-BH015]